MDKSLNDKIINEIMIHLYNYDYEKLDWSMLKLHIDKDLNINIDENLRKEIFQIITSKDLCEQEYGTNKWNLKLTPNGKSVIFKHKNYFDYKKSIYRNNILKKTSWVISVIVSPFLISYCIYLLQKNDEANKTKSEEKSGIAKIKKRKMHEVKDTSNHFFYYRTNKKIK